MRRGQDKKSFLHRSRVDIIACMLRHSASGQRKTSLIYRCNLNTTQFKTYENCLTEAGLLEMITDGGGEMWKTTKKGRRFLRDYARIKRVLDGMLLQKRKIEVISV